MNRTLLFSTIMLLAATGCKKKSDDAPPATYMPNTANSSWNYDTKTYAPTPATGSYTLKATNKDTLIGGRTYRVCTKSNGQNEYYAQVGNEYYQFGSVNGLGTSTDRVELLYLKDAAAGTTWSETKTVTLTGLPAPLTIPLNYEITKTGFDTTINGKAYKNVMHVKGTMGTIILSLGGIPYSLRPVSNLNFYYARGIGRIYSRGIATVTIPGLPNGINVDEELILNSYNIQ